MNFVLIIIFLEIGGVFKYNFFIVLMVSLFIYLVWILIVVNVGEIYFVILILLKLMIEIFFGIWMAVFCNVCIVLMVNVLFAVKKVVGWVFVFLIKFFIVW